MPAILEGHLRPLITMGSDAESIRDRALENVKARRLMRSRACNVILGRAADAVTASARGVELKERVEVPEGCGTAERLLAHGRWTGSVLNRYFDPISPATKHLLDAALVEMDRIARDEDEHSLASVMSAALDNAEADGDPDAAAALFLRDCASLVRHLDSVYDSRIATVIDEMPDFWMSAARCALEYRRRGVVSDAEKLAETALRETGRGVALTVDQPWKTWMLEITWMLLRCMSRQAVQLSPAKAA